VASSRATTTRLESAADAAIVPRVIASKICQGGLNRKHAPPFPAALKDLHGGKQLLHLLLGCST
jgi:hypothetical protein